MLRLIRLDLVAKNKDTKRLGMRKEEYHIGRLYNMLQGLGSRQEQHNQAQ